jgi:hypothetical protein
MQSGERARVRFSNGFNVPFWRGAVSCQWQQIAQRFNAGFHDRRKDQVPPGTKEASSSLCSILPSLMGLNEIREHVYPALKRWAITGLTQEAPLSPERRLF